MCLWYLDPFSILQNMTSHSLSQTYSWDKLGHCGYLTKKIKFQVTCLRSLRMRTSRAGARGARMAVLDSTPHSLLSSSSDPSVTSVDSEAVAAYTECEHGFKQWFRDRLESNRPYLLLLISTQCDLQRPPYNSHFKAFSKMI